MSIDPPSKTIATGPPEILHNIFSLLDQHTLMVCIQVSRFWYTHGRTLAWQAFSIDLYLFLRIACDIHLAVATDKDKRREQDKYNDRLHDFIENCHHIRSLTLTRPSLSLTKFKLPGTLHPRVAGLKNLNHLTVQLKQVIYGENASESFGWAGAILSQNPGIQEIEWQQDGWFDNDNTFASLMLKRAVGGKLKKITIDAYFGVSTLPFLEYLIEANKKRQKRLEQEQGQQEGPKITTQGALMDGSVKHETESKNETNNNINNSNDNHDHGCFELEELVLRDDRQRSKVLWLRLYALHDSPDNLPIRSLRFINFEPLTRTGHFPDDDTIYPDDEGQDYGIGNSILPILNRCPELEKLCVSFDRHPVLPDNSSIGFLDNLAKNSHYSRDPSTNKVGEEDDL